MARPSCPMCGDPFSVVKVSRFYRSHYFLCRDGMPGEQPLTEFLAPPRLSSLPGLYLGIAALIGTLLWLGSGFSLFCLALSLCLGTAVEVVLHCDQLQGIEHY